MIHINIMAFRMLHRCAIFLFTISLKVLANSCNNDNCKDAIDIPLVTKLNAPLKAELDISILTKQLKELIAYEVKQAVSLAMDDFAETIVNKRAETALDNLKTYNNLTISTFQQEIEDDTVRKDDFQDLCKKQTLTESRLSFVESEVKRTAERVAVSLYTVDQTYALGSIIPFNGIRTSTGINSLRLADISNKGYFTCDKQGIYLVAISLVTHTASQQVFLLKNAIIIKRISLTHETIDETTTLTLFLQLNVGNTVSLKAAGNVYIHGKEHSELTILKM